MSLALQLLTGTLVCALCALLQLLVVVAGLRRIDASPPRMRLFLTANSVIIILVAHLLQIGLWAGLFRLLGAFADAEEAVYFAMASYTTLGYGDLLIGADFRVMAAMSAVAGLISFGISTAFLFGAFSELLRHDGERR